MQFLPRYVAITLSALTLVLFLGQSAYAHLMVAQHGTLNVVDDGVFLVLSLPLSAFKGVDDDGDGKISMLEFNAHRGDIVKSIKESVTLDVAQTKASLQGLILSPVQPHDSTSQVISQLAVMGRFILADPTGDLRFHLGLFGTGVTERAMEITVTRKSDQRNEVYEFTPASPTRSILQVEL